MKRSSGPLAALSATLAAAAFFSSCKKEAPPIAYEAVPVERRDIVVSAQASGAIQPDTTVEVKSKASGEILELGAEIGDAVKAGQMLVRIDPRTPRNLVDQSQAELNAAIQREQTAKTQLERGDKLRENAWNISKTAEVIGTPRSNLYKKLEQYAITQESDG